MLLDVSKRSIKTLFFLPVLLCCAVSSPAAEDAWLRLQAPRFGIVSQLKEEETRRWAEEFDKFVTALHKLYSTDDKYLTPLTIILFKNEKQFSPYRRNTGSGQGENIIGLFANRDDWSIIALPGLKDYQKTRKVIFHEAVHWYTNSQNFDTQLWLEEGVAELFSTFELRNGKGRWGLPIQSHIDYLNYIDLQPTREFLYATQDEALHELDTYYPQAWAMVHYFMFGNRRENRGKFAAFLSALSKETTENAFKSAFGISYEEFDRDLQRYVHYGKYYIDEIALAGTDTELEVGPASDAMVRFALGRLAIAGDNFPKGIEHAKAIISSMPNRPEGYELLAMASVGPENQSRQREALNKAISLKTNDSKMYFMKATVLIEENWKNDHTLDEALEKDIARQVADMYKKSIMLQPTNKSAYEGFAVALLNLNAYEETDKKILELGKHIYPQEGSIPVGFAALAKMDENIDSFNRYLEDSFGDSMRLSIDLRMSLRDLQQYAYHELLLNRLQPLMQKGKFEEADALLEQQNSLSFRSGNMQKVLDNMETIIYSEKRLYEATVAMKAFKFDEAAAILKDIENDDKVPRMGKSAARRMMSHIENSKSYLDKVNSRH